MYDVVVKSSRSLSRLLMSFLYVVLRSRSRLDDRAFAAASPQVWNSLHVRIRQLDLTGCFASDKDAFLSLLQRSATDAFSALTINILTHLLWCCCGVVN